MRECLPWFTMVVLLVFIASESVAQSGSSTQPRYSQPARPAPAPAASENAEKAASGAKEDEAPVALRGYCPVCLLEMRQWIKGSDQIAMSYDGKTYYFPELKQLEMFQANPMKYVPKLGGDCPVHFAQTGERVAGDLRIGAVYHGRLVFLASDQHRQAFHATPEAYVNVDLAHGGECLVCRVDGNMRSPGQEELTLLHHGMRYQFASEDHLQAFVRDPARYVEAVNDSATRPLGSGNTTAPRGGSGSGGR